MGWGASGPTLDTDDTMELDSLVHDALYQLMREGCLPQSARKAADKLMRPDAEAVKACRIFVVGIGTGSFAGVAGRQRRHDS